MRVGIIGAGPSGSYLAYLLASQGGEVLLFDKFNSREKPCGGAVTSKALESMLLFAEDTPKRTYIRNIQFEMDNRRSYALEMEFPLCIFSRRELDGFICKKAVDSSANFIPEQVTLILQTGRGWLIETKNLNKYEVDFLVGADGAKSIVRSKLSRSFSATDLALTLGYYVSGNYHPDIAICRFMGNGLPGYLWSFPRYDHLSVGIIGSLSGASSTKMRNYVKEFIVANYSGTGVNENCLFSAVVPELTSRGWKQNRFSGDTWALMGDAAGFVDPITGEGIYYALRSAEILADLLKRGKIQQYSSICWREMIDDFMCAATWKQRFGSLFSLIGRIATGSWRSKSLRKLENDFVAGKVSYRTLSNNLLRRAPLILAQMILSKIRFNAGRSHDKS